MHTVIVSGWMSTWMRSRLEGNQMKGEKNALWDAHEMILSGNPQKAGGERTATMGGSPIK